MNYDEILKISDAITPITRRADNYTTVASFEDTLLKESGNYKTYNMFISFFYSLLRDYVHVGDFEKALKDTVNYREEHVLSNGYLAKYAEYVYGQLKLVSDLNKENS